jgi:hypothetical protein
MAYLPINADTCVHKSMLTRVNKPLQLQWGTPIQVTLTTAVVGVTNGDMSSIRIAVIHVFQVLQAWGYAGLAPFTKSHTKGVVGGHAQRELLEVTHKGSCGGHTQRELLEVTHNGSFERRASQRTEEHLQAQWLHHSKDWRSHTKEVIGGHTQRKFYNVL